MTPHAPLFFLKNRNIQTRPSIYDTLAATVDQNCKKNQKCTTSKNPIHNQVPKIRNVYTGTAEGRLDKKRNDLSYEDVRDEMIIEHSDSSSIASSIDNPGPLASLDVPTKRHYRDRNCNKKTQQKKKVIVDFTHNLVPPGFAAVHNYGNRTVSTVKSRRISHNKNSHERSYEPEIELCRSFRSHTSKRSHSSSRSCLSGHDREEHSKHNDNCRSRFVSSTISRQTPKYQEENNNQIIESMRSSGSCASKRSLNNGKIRSNRKSSDNDSLRKQDSRNGWEENDFGHIAKRMNSSSTVRHSLKDDDDNDEWSIESATKSAGSARRKSQTSAESCYSRNEGIVSETSDLDRKNSKKKEDLEDDLGRLRIDYDRYLEHKRFTAARKRGLSFETASNVIEPTVDPAYSEKIKKWMDERSEKVSHFREKAMKMQEESLSRKKTCKHCPAETVLDLQPEEEIMKSKPFNEPKQPMKTCEECSFLAATNENSSSLQRPNSRISTEIPSLENLTKISYEAAYLEPSAGKCKGVAVYEKTSSYMVEIANLSILAPIDNVGRKSFTPSSQLSEKESLIDSGVKHKLQCSNLLQTNQNSLDDLMDTFRQRICHKLLEKNIKSKELEDAMEAIDRAVVSLHSAQTNEMLEKSLENLLDSFHTTGVIYGSLDVKKVSEEVDDVFESIKHDIKTIKDREEPEQGWLGDWQNWFKGGREEAVKDRKRLTFIDSQLEYLTYTLFDTQNTGTSI